MIDKVIILQVSRMMIKMSLRNPYDIEAFEDDEDDED